MGDKANISGSLAMTPKLITIPAADQENTRQLRVAAYARVSSDSTDQLHSFAAQNAYFSKLITENPAWELADIYADKGITGTSIDKREEFLRMMEDCRKGRIDRILVKSISRFGRNTQESLEAVRELKSLGISVLFEEQNIDTAQTSGEMLTAIFAILAQKESESISEKMRQSCRMRMWQGTFLPSSVPYGYHLHQRKVKIVPEEAAVIRDIFHSYLAGESMQAIADRLNTTGIPLRVSSKTQIWRVSTIEYILSNEKYIGDSLWQKSYQTQTLPHKYKKNKGELDQYYWADTHPAIIDRDIFQKVQKLRAIRALVSKPATDDAVRERLYCGCCGTPYRSIQGRNFHSYECQAKNHGTVKCSSPRVPEDQIHAAFLRIYFKLKHYGVDTLKRLISDLRLARQNGLLWSEDIVELNKQISDIASQERLLAQLKQQGVVDPDIFISRGNLLAERRREIKRRKEQLLRTEEDDTIQQTEELLNLLESGPDWLDSFDAELFENIVEKIIVVDHETLRFRLLNGLEATEHVERRKR